MKFKPLDIIVNTSGDIALVLIAKKESCNNLAFYLLETEDFRLPEFVYAEARFSEMYCEKIGEL